MRSNLRAPLAHLALSGAVGEDDKTWLCTDLAGHLSGLGKRALLIDLDRQGSRFKKTIGYDTNAGFTDLCYKFFDEPFFSRSAKDYGLADLLTLFFLKARTGRLVFSSVKTPSSVQITFCRGRPVEIQGVGISLSDRVGMAAKILRPETTHSETAPNTGPPEALAFLASLVKTGAFTAGEMAALFDNHTSVIMEEILDRPADLFEYADLSPEPFLEADGWLPQTPSYLSRPPSQNGFITRQIESFCVTAASGFKFMPHGQFPIKSGEIASRYARLAPLLRSFFDVILINAPAYPGNPLAREMARIADGTVLVVKSGAVDRKGFGRILSDMRAHGVNLLGTVLNEVESDPRTAA